MPNINGHINLFLLLLTFFLSEQSFGRASRISDAQRTVMLLSGHRHICGEPPDKQVWYKKGKFKSTCSRFSDERLNKYVDSLDSIEIVGKNIYIVDFSKRRKEYIVSFAIFTDNGTKIWNRFIGYDEISFFCEKFQAPFCDSFLMLKIKYHKVFRIKK